MAQTERQWGEHQRVVQSSTVAGFDGSANTRESPAIRALMIVISDMGVGSGPPVALYHLAHTSSRQVINNRGLLLLDGVPVRLLFEGDPAGGADVRALPADKQVSGARSRLDRA